MIYGPSYEDVSYSAAVNVCENCGRSCDAAREDAREAAKKPVGVAFVLQQTAPHFAVIGNGLYVRTASKRGNL